MKKIIYLIVLVFGLSILPTDAAPAGSHRAPGMGRPPMHAGASYTHRPAMGHPTMSRPPMARPPMGAVHRPVNHVARRPLPPPPPLYRPYRPIVRPYYYSSIYYPTTYYSTSYTYYPYSNYIYDGVEPVPASVNTVVVRDDYAGINTTANVINAAANVAATIRYLTW